jgi:hypothetical protein
VLYKLLQRPSTEDLVAEIRRRSRIERARLVRGHLHELLKGAIDAEEANRAAERDHDSERMAEDREAALRRHRQDLDDGQAPEPTWLDEQARARAEQRREEAAHWTRFSGATLEPVEAWANGNGHGPQPAGINGD